jgi:ligand-binding SRPBCC domain-containing protein
MSKSLALAMNWAYHQLPDALGLLTITWRIWRLKAYSWALGTNKTIHYANGQPLPPGESGAGYNNLCRHKHKRFGACWLVGDGALAVL